MTATPPKRGEWARRTTTEPAQHVEPRSAHPALAGLHRNQTFSNCVVAPDLHFHAAKATQALRYRPKSHRLTFICSLAQLAQHPPNHRVSIVRHVDNCCLIILDSLRDDAQVCKARYRGSCVVAVVRIGRRARYFLMMAGS